jgi:hypothetical protein
MFAANTVTTLASVALMALGIWRSAQMARGFVDRVYKSKALWMAALMSSILISELSVFVQFPQTTVGSLLAFSPLILVIVVSYAFVDRTILVAMRSDFFHRDVIGWMKVRIPGFVLVAVAICLAAATSALIPSSSSTVPFWSTVTFNAFVVVVPVVLGYAALAVVISARRTADRTLKRHIILIGLSLACFAGLLALFATPNTDFFNLVADALNVGSLYLLYRAVMSLTPLGRLERGAELFAAPPGMVPSPAGRATAPGAIAAAPANPSRQERTNNMASVGGGIGFQSER